MASMDEVKKMMQKPCPKCGSDKMYYQCCGTDEAKMVGMKMCPVHKESMLKDCCMAKPEEHKM